MFEYHLIQIGEGAFSFQIVLQDDKITNYVTSRQNKTFYANNGWRVMIDKHPEVDVQNKIVYLQGKKTSKNERVHSNYGLNGKENKKVIQAVHATLKDLVGSAKAWKNKREPRFFETIIIDPCAYNPLMAFRSFPNVFVVRGPGCDD